MLYPVNRIKIVISGSDEIIETFIQHWDSFSYNNLRRRDNTFHRSNFERNNETMVLSVYARDSISLCVFETLVKKFYQLNFKFYAKRVNPKNRHALLYQNGKKIRHFHEYSERINLNENNHIEIVYVADHVNKKLKILEKQIHEGYGYYDKTFNIVYENHYLDYVEEVKQDDKQCLDNYKIWF